MKMIYKSGFLSFSIILIITAGVSAQSTSKNKGLFKPPVVKTTIGIRSGRDTVVVDEARQLVKLPLLVKDANGNIYKISNYRFLYRQKGYLENPETGKPEIHYTAMASRFDNSPLPKVWSDNLQTKIQPGEELYFFEILVSDNLGRQFYAPDLVITIR